MLSLLMLTACVPEGDTLTALAEAWADETVSVAGPSVTAALVMGGMATELCKHRVDDVWEGVEAGDIPPFSPVMLQALGMGTSVVDIQDFGGASRQVTLQPITISDREQAFLRFSTNPSADSFGIEATAFDGKIEDADSGSREPFGRMSFTVRSDCQVAVGLVQGNGRWTDLDERTHEIAIPADSSLSTGVLFDEAWPYIPNSGTLAWSARIDGQERTVTAYDAGDVVFEGDGQGDLETLPRARWPAVVRGADWDADAAVPIAPAG